MKIAVLWSGGLDSTYLIYKALRDNHEVTAFSIDLKNNEDQIKHENIAKEKLVKAFRKEFRNFSYDGCLFSIDVHKPASFRLQQPPLWVLGMAYIGSHRYDEIQIGYVSNDDAISFLPEIRRLYNSYSPFSEKEKLSKLTFPLIKMKKEEILDALPEKYKSMVSFCETPRGDGSPCHHCHSCQVHFLATRDCEVVYNVDRKIMDKAIIIGDDVEQRELFPREVICDELVCNEVEA